MFIMLHKHHQRVIVYTVLTMATQCHRVMAEDMDIATNCSLVNRSNFYKSLCDKLP